MESDVCVLCENGGGVEASGGRIVNVGEKGIEGMKNASKQRGDGLHEKFNLHSGMQVHDVCRRNYTRPSSIDKFCKSRKADSSSDPALICCRTRSAEVEGFQIKTHCLFCAKIVDFRALTKLPYKYRKVVHRVETITIKETILDQVTVRGDDWSREVDTRIREASDLVAAEAVYHHNCYAQFFSVRENSRGDESSQKRDAFSKLCDYLDENDECQYSLGELSDVMDTFLTGNEGYTAKHLKNKLVDRYGQNITVTELPGRVTILSFRLATHKILHERWHHDRKSTQEEERLRVVEAAAEIIRADIRGTVYNVDEYPAVDPDSLDVQSLCRSIPSSLKLFLDTTLRSKSSDVNSVELKKVAIGQAIISACRPRSFLSPILTGLGLYVHNHYGSRLLVDLLYRLGFSASYTEVQRYEFSLLSQAKPQHSSDSYIQFIFDNADFNVRTLDGKGTFHAMGGIKCTTPISSTVAVNVPRVKLVPSAAQIAAMGSFPISWYKKPSSPGLKNCTIKDVYAVGAPENGFSTRSLDVLWMVGSWLELSPRPSWNGYMQAAFQGSGSGTKSSVEPVPFINLDPGNLSTINTALQFAAEQCTQLGQSSCFVTFDQPLYAKAVDIVASAEPGSALNIVKVRLGGFHLLISFLGAAGFIMSGSGLQDVWAEVYAKASIPHMTTGHAYARSIRAHFLTQLALGILLLRAMSPLSNEDLEVLRKLHQDLFINEIHPDNATASEALHHLVTSFTEKCDEEESRSRTGKLWIEYFRMVSLMRLYIRAERTGDFQLHISCIKAMLPYFHSSGHLQYAKYAHHYVQQMEDLSRFLNEDELHKFVTQGYFTIRRTERFWSGNWSDMVIEQELMRSLKVSGGLTRGRGITDSNLAKFVLAQPASCMVTSAMEKLCHLDVGTSEQHVELRDSRQARDELDLKKILSWLESHSPFSGRMNGQLVCLSNGVVGDSKVNPDLAKEVGLHAMSEMIGQSFGEVKLKRKNKVVPLSAMNGTIRVRDQEIEVNSHQLFLRITCVLKSPSDYEEYMCFELAPKPPSLFDGALMRKTSKSALADILEKRAPLLQSCPQNCTYVVDGGHLLHQVVWPKPATYDQVCSAYVSFVLAHYGSGSTVVFDGYDGPTTTKNLEQQRRSLRAHSTNVIVDLNTTVSANQSDFLSNTRNKSRLITVLTPKLNNAGVFVTQAAADADALIVSTALQKTSEGLPVVVVGTDTDVLSMLVHGVNCTSDLLFLKPGGQKPDKIFPISTISENIGKMKECILFAHAFTGCDTTSAIFKKGKRGMWKLFEKDHELQKSAAIFYDPTTNPNDLALVGEECFLKLYAGEKCQSLNELRYFMLNKVVARQKLSAKFDLAVLPPTSDAARLHTFRVYLQVQQWLGHSLNPVSWGWRDVDGLLTPLPMCAPPAPESLLCLITCDCKKECSRACDCKRSDLPCSPMCGHCRGRDCSNSPRTTDSDEDEDTL